MNIKNIKSLAEIVNNFNLTSIEVEEGETKIKIERNIGGAVQASAVPSAPVYISAEAEVSNVNTPAVSGGKEVTAPMIGVFYAAPSPDDEPYVTVGSKVKKGDVLCIIEAMKLMNEITSEYDGEIVEICVQNEQVVEYGQPIFKIK